MDDQVKVGDTVLFSEPGLPTGNNGRDTAPAMVVAVWSADTVNLRVFCDGPEVLWRTSVQRHQPQRDDGAPAQTFAAMGSWRPL